MGGSSSKEADVDVEEAPLIIPDLRAPVPRQTAREAPIVADIHGNNNNVPGEPEFPQTEKRKDFYDVVFQIDQVNQIEPGWPVKFNDPIIKELLLNRAVEWNSSVMTVQGQYKRGKTFVLNLLTNSTLPSSKIMATVGLSFKLTKTTKGQQVVLVDAAGVHTPIIARPEETMSEALAHRKATEFFLRDVALQIADIVLVVVTDFGDIDQEIIVSICQSIQLKLKNSPATQIREEVYVVHNFMNSTLEEAESQWEKYVLRSYEKVGELEELEGVQVLRHNERVNENDRPIQVKHVYLCNHNADPGHNQKVAQLLLNWVSSGVQPIQRKNSPLDFVKDACKSAISRYLTGVDEIEYDKVSTVIKTFAIATATTPDEGEQESFEKLQQLIKEKFEIPLKIPDPKAVVEAKKTTTKMKSKDCMFEAVSQECPGKKPAELRKEVVEWLRNNEDKQIANFPLSSLLTDYRSKTWKNYCTMIEKGGAGDHITLVALAEILQRPIAVVSALSASTVDGAFRFIVKPAVDSAKPPICLGHWHQNYYTLIKPISSSMGTKFEDFQMWDTMHDEQVLRTKSNKGQQPATVPVSLKDYSLNPNMGVQFDLTDSFLVKYTEHQLDDNTYEVQLDVPGTKGGEEESDALSAHVHPTDTRKIVVTGTREKPTGSIIHQNTRKFGKWQYVFDTPEGYDPATVSLQYQDGVLHIQVTRGKPVIRKIPVKTKV